jgi:hypothetical protein
VQEHFIALQDGCRGRKVFIKFLKVNRGNHFGGNANEYKGATAWSVSIFKSKFKALFVRAFISGFTSTSSGTRNSKFNNARVQ